MLKGEHSAILLTFIKLPFVIKIFVLSIFELPFYIGFTVVINRAPIYRVYCSVRQCHKWYFFLCLGSVIVKGAKSCSAWHAHIIHKGSNFKKVKIFQMDHVSNVVGQTSVADTDREKYNSSSSSSSFD